MGHAYSQRQPCGAAHRHMDAHAHTCTCACTCRTVMRDSREPREASGPLTTQRAPTAARTHGPTAPQALLEGCERVQQRLHLVAVGKHVRPVSLARPLALARARDEEREAAQPVKRGERVLVRHVVANVDGHHLVLDLVAGEAVRAPRVDQVVEQEANRRTLVPHGRPWELRPHLEDAFARRHLEAVSRLYLGPRRRLHLATQRLRHIPPVHRDGELIVLDGRARDRGDAGLERVTGRSESRQRLLTDAVAEAVGPRDVEAVRAGVEERGEAHEILHFLPRAARDDGDLLGRGEPFDGGAHGLGQERVIRIRHDRREGAVVIDKYHEPLAGRARSKLVERIEGARKRSHRSSLRWRQLACGRWWKLALGQLAPRPRARRRYHSALLQHPC
mmetsp:Transcript_15235/g.41024  ORF Transcript_15235/g.41024 Transcript_15235/m.41024 type:complete len:390 (+) Transcript_15235:77-1246(+)